MTDPAHQNLSGRALRGGLWVFLAKGFEAGSRLLGNIVLAWLLFEEAFGILVPVRVFLIGMQLFSDVGIGPSIVRSKRGENSLFLRTVWTVQVLRGLLLYAICWALAGPYSRLIGDPLTESGLPEQEMIHSLLLVAGLSAVFLGFRSPHWFTMDRRIAQGRKTMVLILSQAIGLVVMLTWAYFDRDPLAMVVGGVTGAFCQMLFSHLMLPGVGMRFRFDKDALRELFGFGRWIFLSTALVFFAGQIDRVIVSGLLDAGPRGLYGIALVIAALVPNILGSVSNSVVFPLWMASANKPGDHQTRLRRSRAGLQGIGMCGLLTIVVVAPFFFTILYQEKYHGAAVLAQLLCIPFWFESLMASTSSVLLVHGDSKALSSGNFLVLLFKAPACWYGFQVGGLEGFILGVAVGNIAGLVCLHWRLHKHGTHLATQDFRATAMVLILGMLGFLATDYLMTLSLWAGVPLAALCLLILMVMPLLPARDLLQQRRMA